MGVSVVISREDAKKVGLKRQHTCGVLSYI
ncbi:hypothetical protein AI2983V1_3988 [Enterobacter cloacae]|jgi:hypothetical protein|nr:hypothetical protein WP8W19C02_40180 [Enterobacter cloacae]CAF3160090.1 hypothetical protein AI2983V1_3988 [Enterobacter cloacae]CAH5710899.1 hypothetical protein AI2983V1_3988 [Enterobacter cloacae]